MGLWFAANAHSGKYFMDVHTERGGVALDSIKIPLRTATNRHFDETKILVVNLHMNGIGRVKE